MYNFSAFQNNQILLWTPEGRLIFFPCLSNQKVAAPTLLQFALISNQWVREN